MPVFTDIVDQAGNATFYRVVLNTETDTVVFSIATTQGSPTDAMVAAMRDGLASVTDYMSATAARDSGGFTSIP